MSRFYEISVKGKFWIHRVADKDTHTHNGDEDEGRMIYSEADEAMYVGSTNAWILLPEPHGVFPAGTKVLMGSYPLPTGWNLDLAYNDVAVNISSTLTDMDASAGSWVISGINANGIHNHGRTGPPSSTVTIGKSGIAANTSSYLHSHAFDKNEEHFHFFSGTWRWPNLKYCVAEFT